MVRSTRSANRRQKQETGVDSLNVTVAGAADIIARILPRITRATGANKVRCLHFAPSHAEFQHKYPDHFFCSKCDNVYQKWVIEGDADRCSVDSSRFMCEATHEDFLFPSQLKPDLESYYGSDDDNNTSTSASASASASASTSASTTTTTTTTTTNTTITTRKKSKRNTVSLEKVASKTNREVKKMKYTYTKDEQGVARMLKSYQELITELKSKLKHLEEVIKKKDIYIGELIRSATK